jgi:hypothetical protein
MPLGPQFSLIHSEFNEFLFAPVGKEENGAVLTVLLALTRLGIDPALNCNPTQRTPGGK